MIQLFDFQHVAAAQIADRFAEYSENPPMGGTAKHPVPVPFYQALAAITASGKTAILAEAVHQIHMGLPVKPLILWLSKGRVVVEQSYANLQPGGKYHHLLGDAAVKLLPEFSAHDVSTENRPVVYFATAGTFNQKDKEKGGLLIYRSEIDTADLSSWEGLKQRERHDGVHRPLLIVYDEAHNLTDQQTNLLMELEPDGVLVASATMKLPAALAKVVDGLRSRGWIEDRLITSVDPSDVVQSGLIKRDVVLGGYKAAMEKTVEDLLNDMAQAKSDAAALGLPIRPKAIYISKTNIVEGNSFRKDDPKRPFKHREAPPILLWRYLVEERKISPEKVLVYANVTFDKSFPPPGDFLILKGGDKDYAQLTEGDFEHIIFNLRLQEGWDDPECYFAYIDKSMGSTVQVEQIVGRLLRQPGAKHYESPSLNSARFYLRVDAKGVFGDIIDTVRRRLRDDGAEVEFSTYEVSAKNKPVLVMPKQALTVPQVIVDAGDAMDPIAKVVAEMSDFREGGVNVLSQGERALVRQRIGDGDEAEIQWIPYEQNNAVSARWIFQLEVQKRFPRALEVTPSDDSKFDAKVELGSNADKHIRATAGKVVELYLDYVRLRQRVHNPFVVGPLMVDPSKSVKFKSALHPEYSGLNKLEQSFARALEDSGTTWARNPSQSGFSIPLVSLGKTRNFFPDFLVWKDSHVFAIDTTGGHLMHEKAGRKLLSVEPSKGTTRLHVRLVSEGKWSSDVKEIDKSGFTVWRLRPDTEIGAIHCETIEEAINRCLLK